MSAKPTIHIIDDDPAMRESLAFLLDVRGFDVQVHESAVAFLGAVKNLQLGCIVTDIRMPDMNGLELVQKLKSEGIDCPVIAITGHGDVALAVESMKAGMVDFIEKPFSNDTMLRAIRSALEQAQAVEPKDKLRQDAVQRLQALSPRERDVLLGLVAGKINKVIAHELNISPRTVDIYRANLMIKTHTRNLSELMRLALAAGL